MRKFVTIGKVRHKLPINPGPGFASGHNVHSDAAQGLA